MTDESNSSIAQSDQQSNNGEQDATNTENSDGSPSTKPQQIEDIMVIVDGDNLASNEQQSKTNPGEDQQKQNDANESLEKQLNDAANDTVIVVTDGANGVAEETAESKEDASTVAAETTEETAKETASDGANDDQERESEPEKVTTDATDAGEIPTTAAESAQKTEETDPTTSTELADSVQQTTPETDVTEQESGKSAEQKPETAEQTPVEKEPEVETTDPTPEASASDAVVIAGDVKEETTPALGTTVTVAETVDDSTPETQESSATTEQKPIEQEANTTRAVTQEQNDTSVDTGTPGPAPTSSPQPPSSATATKTPKPGFFTELRNFFRTKPSTNSKAPANSTSQTAGKKRADTTPTSAVTSAAPEQS